MTRRARRDRRDHRDRGAADALGLVLIAPAVIGLAILVVVLGRRVESEALMRTAAESAAQAAALERTSGAAQLAGEAVALSMLTDIDSCTDPSVDIVYPTTRPVAGAPAPLVEATVSCTVSNRGVEILQQRPREGSVRAVAPLDIFRAQP